MIGGKIRRHSTSFLIDYILVQKNPMLFETIYHRDGRRPNRNVPRPTNENQAKKVDCNQALL